MLCLVTSWYQGARREGGKPAFSRRKRGSAPNTALPSITSSLGLLLGHAAFRDSETGDGWYRDGNACVSSTET